MLYRNFSYAAKVFCLKLSLTMLQLTSIFKLAIEQRAMRAQCFKRIQSTRIIIADRTLPTAKQNTGIETELLPLFHNPNFDL